MNSNSALSNDGLAQEFSSLKKMAKRYSVFLTSIVVLFIIAVIYFTRGSSSAEIKNLKKENQALKKEFSALQERYKSDSAAQAAVAEQINQMREERNMLMSAINNTTYLLGKFKPLYEKVKTNNYQSVPANDSLSRLFNNRFLYDN